MSFNEGLVNHGLEYKKWLVSIFRSHAICLLNASKYCWEEVRRHIIEDLRFQHKDACEDGVSEIELTVMNRLVRDSTLEEMLHNVNNVFYYYRYI